MTPTKRLIINADDLGFSPAVNQAVLAGACRGTITAASLMVNMPFAEAAAEAVRDRCPDLSLALHFCLTTGRPVAEPESISLLVDRRGVFRHGFLGLWRSLRSGKHREAFREQVRTEFRAQADRMERLAEHFGLRFDHLDSHQHVHVLPGLLELFRDEAQRRGLALRIPRERFGGVMRLLRRFPAWFPQGLLKRAILNGHLRGASQEIGYFGILESGNIGENALEEIIRAIGRSGPGVDLFEVNVHPSIGEAAQPEHGTDSVEAGPADRTFHASPRRRREFDALQSVRESAERHRIRLVGFPDS